MTSPQTQQDGLRARRARIGAPQSETTPCMSMLMTITLMHQAAGGDPLNQASMAVDALCSICLNSDSHRA